MGTIEEAAKRLDQLRRAGVHVPQGVDVPTPQAITAPADPAPDQATLQAADASPASIVIDPPANHASANDPVVAITINMPGEPGVAVEPGENWQGEGRSRVVNADLSAMVRASLLTPGAPRSRLEEEFRLIKRPILENIRGMLPMRPLRANLIMVTSAVAGEGKTQSAINLAVSIAMELDRTVLLVEADVLRPSLLSRMGISASKGLLDLLAGDVTDLADVLLRTNIPKLSLLPAGAARTSSTELLASAAMESLLDDLAGRYSDRVIIFDTPPLISTTESRALASHMGQVLMVVEAYATPLHIIKQAYATVESHPLVMSMLNKYSGPRSNDLYGYYAP
jgi:protein-tyrosine kinase